MVECVAVVITGDESFVLSTALIDDLSVSARMWANELLAKYDAIQVGIYSRCLATARREDSL